MFYRLANSIPQHIGFNRTCKLTTVLQHRYKVTSASKIQMKSDEPIYIKSFPIHKLLRPTLDDSIPKIVLVSCGSFSPITNLHLMLFEIIRNYLTKEIGRFDVVGGIVSPVHDHYGKKSLVPQQHRFQMCKLATDTSEWIATSPWEVEQDDWTPTKKVLEHYQSVLDDGDIMWGTDRPIDVRCKLIMGTDVLATFLEPGAWSDEDTEIVLGNMGVIVLERPEMGSTRDLVDNSPLLAKYRDNIIICPMSIENNVSSTKVRTLLQKDQSVKYLIDDQVANYIYKHGLYDARSQRPMIHPEVIGTSIDMTRGVDMIRPSTSTSPKSSSSSSSSSSAPTSYEKNLN